MSTSDSDSPRKVIIQLHADMDSPQAIEFYRRLGMCVTIWAYVDRRLYQIFHHATGFEQKQSALLYYRNRNFNQRVRMVNDAVKVELSKDEYKFLWLPLFEECIDLSHARNIIVHQPTFRLGTARDGEPFDVYSIHIEPYERLLNDDYPGLRGKESLETQDLIEHAADVGELENKLHDFAWVMGGRRAAKKHSS